MSAAFITPERDLSDVRGGEIIRMRPDMIERATGMIYQARGAMVEMARQTEKIAQANLPMSITGLAQNAEVQPEVLPAHNAVKRHQLGSQDQDFRATNAPAQPATPAMDEREQRAADARDQIAQIAHDTGADNARAQIEGFQPESTSGSPEQDDRREQLTVDGMSFEDLLKEAA
jgi:hypothetical protein